MFYEYYNSFSLSKLSKYSSVKIDALIKYNNGLCLIINNDDIIYKAVWFSC